jgi:hypothetical protein
MLSIPSETVVINLKQVSIIKEEIMLFIKKCRNFPVVVLVLTALFLVGFYGTGMAADKMSAKPGKMMEKKMINEPAVIHFVDITGVKDWHAEGLNAILIEGVNGQWYRATFFSECFGLPWAEKVAFVTSPDGSLDKFSSVLVNGQQCYFKDANKIPDPFKYSTENPLEVQPER